jgi:hypothetical protein
MNTQNIFSNGILNVVEEAGDLTIGISIGFRVFLLVW